MSKEFKKLKIPFHNSDRYMVHSSWSGSRLTLLYFCRGRIHAVSEEESRAILASITEEELGVFRSAFSMFDRNGDGSISTNVRGM